MADFSIISDTSAALLRLLRESLCPDPVVSPESIALASPADKSGDFQLGLFLYDLRELSEYRSTTPISTGSNSLSKPPKQMSLFYLLFLNNKAQIAAGAEMEQRIFGRAIQALYDTATLNIAAANPYLAPEEAHATLALLNHSFEDKTKIWSALQSPYQIAVYFTAAPVLLSSRVEQRITRVTDAAVTTGIIGQS